MKGTIASVGIGIATVFGAIEASVFNETPLERVETIKNERVEVKQVGNIVETAMPWKGEPGIKIKVDMGEPTLTERLADKRKMEVVTEVLNENFKIDFLLNEKPDTNIFCQTIEGAEQYDWFYQPELTPEEIAEGAERPENVIGSYAVYHKTLANHRIGGVNYETGKAWHIYRPQVWSLSSSSTKEWADLSFADNQLCVTVPQTFLDHAVYPVKVDPTFGYTSAGVSNIVSLGGSPNVSRMRGVAFSLAEDGTLDKVSMYLDDSGSSDTCDLAVAIYREDSAGSGSHGKVLDIQRTNVVVSSTNAWYDFTGSSQSLLIDTYVLAGIANGEEIVNSLRLWYDSGGTSRNKYFEQTAAAGSFATRLAEDPWTEDATADTNEYSIYATYTAAGGAAAPIQQSELWF